MQKLFPFDDGFMFSVVGFMVWVSEYILQNVSNENKLQYHLLFQVYTNTGQKYTTLNNKCSTWKLVHNIVVHISVSSNCSDLKRWPWKSKVKVDAKVKEIIATLKIQDRGHGQDQTRW